MPISRSLRFQVLKRDDHACRYCGAVAPDVKLHIDHVTPIALGGTDDPTNLVTACSDCNGGKAATPPDAATVAAVAADAERWTAALKMAAESQVRAEMEERDRQEAIASEFREAWDIFTYGPEHRPVPLPSSWRASVVKFTDLGLPMAVLYSAVHTAMATDRVAPADTFRYMCGIAWRKVAELQEAAKAILADG